MTSFYYIPFEIIINTRKSNIWSIYFLSYSRSYI
jgi:hypothetical protein